MVGRPRENGDRHPCGKLVQAAEPPERLLERRSILVGEANARDQKASYPLGILHLRGQLMQADYDAAMRFSAAYAIIWGKGTVASHLKAFLPGGGEDISESRLLEIADELGEAIAALHRLPTRRPYDVLVNIGPFERILRFMDTSRARSPAAWRADQHDLDALQEATAALVAVWKTIDREKAMARHAAN